MMKADYVDPMEELEVEMKKQREAKLAESRLKAQQQALFDLDRMPAEEPPQQQQAAAKSSSSSSAPLLSRGGGSPSAGNNRSPNANADNAAVFIPKSWHTAGQEPDLLPANQQTDDRFDNGVVVENESITLGMCGCGGPGGGASTQFFAMAGLHPPSDASFESFFRVWFETEFFPTMSEDLKRELVHRAKSKGFFSGLSSQVKKWAMANTDARLQSDVWCSYFIQNAPPRFRVIGPLKIASANLGSQAAPCWLSFWGFPENETQRLSSGGTGTEGAKWALPPFCGGSPDISALLDELDGRGGMTALLAAAA